MLALDRRELGATMPSDFKPFGYEIIKRDRSQPPYSIFPQSPAPAPGPALLDDHESKFLSSFFDDVSNDLCDFNNTFGSADADPLDWGSTTWDDVDRSYEDVAPTTYDLSPRGLPTQPRQTPYTQRPQTIYTQPLQSVYDHQPPNPYGQQSQSLYHQQPQGPYGQQLRSPSGHQPQMGFHISPLHNGSSQIPSLAPEATSPIADMIAAATALQNSSHGGRMEAMRSQSRQVAIPRGESRNREGFLYHSAMRREPSQPGDLTRDPFITDMVFGSANAQSPTQRRPTPHTGDVNYGTDSSFGAAQGFVAPDSSDTLAALEQSHLQTVVGAFEQPSPHPASVRSTSPSTPTAGLPPYGPHSTDNEVESSSRIRKGKYPAVQDNASDKGSPSTSAPQSKRRKTNKRSLATADPNDSSGPSRKRKTAAGKKSSAAAESRLPRTNLTDEQKRENHIASEQKRREAIAKAFEELAALVPALGRESGSKSDNLKVAADWLEELMDGNKILTGRLEALKRGVGKGMVVVVGGKGPDSWETSARVEGVDNAESVASGSASADGNLGRSNRIAHESAMRGFANGDGHPNGYAMREHANFGAVILDSGNYDDGRSLENGHFEDGLSEEPDFAGPAFNNLFPAVSR